MQFAWTTDVYVVVDINVVVVKAFKNRIESQQTHTYTYVQKGEKK